MKNRIDKELVDRALAQSRTKAQELIESGYVKCNNKVIKKCNYLVEENDVLQIIENDKFKYVSRGGLKLEKAINEFAISFKNLNVMDIGSSTGGFCDCALQHGAKHIIAVDVGTDIMDSKLRANNKIDLHEKTDFRKLPHNYFENVDIITVDVSFISLEKVIEKVSSENVKIDMVCLIKPQFECGREIASKYKGIILNKKIHIDIINKTIKTMNKYGFYIKNISSSPIKGGDGNIEYISYITNKESTNEKIDVIKLVNSAF